jgi:hypothetical protein
MSCRPSFCELEYVTCLICPLYRQGKCRHPEAEIKKITPRIIERQKRKIERGLV